MIAKNQLAKLAEAKKLTLKNAEKDYLQELILFNLYREVGNKLVFKGGTALYKTQGLNRFSEDLDFTQMARRLDIQSILLKILRSLTFLGIEGKIKEFKEFSNELNVRLTFKGPLYTGNPNSLAFISLNISKRERVLSDVDKVLIVTNYPEIVSFEVFTMNCEEILAEKIRAILSRDKARDVYDLWFLLKKGVKLNQNLILRKLKKKDIEFTTKLLFKEIDLKKQQWNADLKPFIIGELPKFESVFIELRQKLSFS
ncbi:MAG: hypothetical protein COT15_03595 [Candidatus Diapherotrites archaeon CG08_land_8_20_14_0_20_34_12]|nr:MAG: hypothetical protein COT15_03595 [Candidatus Diapherotrites archaeon CG08_land_8_20_14_0_20_34_12]